MLFRSSVQRGSAKAFGKISRRPLRKRGNETVVPQRRRRDRQAFKELKAHSVAHLDGLESPAYDLLFDRGCLWHCAACVQVTARAAARANITKTPANKRARRRFTLERVLRYQFRLAPLGGPKSRLARARKNMDRPERVSIGAEIVRSLESAEYPVNRFQ